MDTGPHGVRADARQASQRDLLPHQPGEELETAGVTPAIVTRLTVSENARVCAAAFP